jgi:hypothetical protein
VSPRLRILGAVAVALLALAGGYLLLGGSTGSSTAAVKTIKPLHPVKKQVVAAKKQPAPQAKKVAAAVKAKPKPKRKAAPAVIDGMPASLALALRSHRVIVVSLYTPGASVDAMATEEAKHGAALAGAGFVSFNVADDKVVVPLSSLLTAAPTPADRVLDGPAVLVFERPRGLFVRFNGFADRDTVAQAAENAATLAR